MDDAFSFLCFYFSSFCFVLFYFLIFGACNSLRVKPNQITKDLWVRESCLIYFLGSS